MGVLRITTGRRRKDEQLDERDDQHWPQQRSRGCADFPPRPEKMRAWLFQSLLNDRCSPQAAAAIAGGSDFEQRYSIRHLQHETRAITRTTARGRHRTRAQRRRQAFEGKMKRKKDIRQNGTEHAPIIANAGDESCRMRMPSESDTRM